MARCCLVVALLATLAATVAFAVDSQGSGNPIRKVVTLLQQMQAKVTAEGEKEKELFDAFMCYCKHGKGDLSASIAEAETKEPAVTSEIEEDEARLEQAKADLKGAQVERSAAERTVAEAKAIREKEASSFAALKADADANIAAINKAVAALERGATGGFLQTDAAQVLRRIASDDRLDLAEADREELIAFISQGAGYAPQSGQIIGVLKQIGETMGKDLADEAAKEEAAAKAFAALAAAKGRETQALTGVVETKTAQVGELGVGIVRKKGDLSDTQNALLQDRKFMAELEKGCDQKAKEWEERSALRAQELVALADTIKVLNDDDALDLFRKTLPAPGASLVQLSASRASERTQALQLIRGVRAQAERSLRPGLDLVALTLSGKRGSAKGTFDKVIGMCDEMIATLKKEQDDDDHKKEYCGEQFDLAEDSLKALARRTADAEVAITEAKDGIATLAEEITSLSAGIAALDKSVTEATKQRQDENAEFKELMASDAAAKDLLEFARNRLNKYYNPKLFKAQPKKELSREERIYVNHGGAPVPEKKPGGIAGTGITVLAQVSAHGRLSSVAVPAPPPATWDAYQKKSEESNGVIGMIQLLIQDLTKEMTEAETAENEAQADYKTMMADAADKRSADTKSLTEKTGAKVDLEAELQSHEDDHKAAVGEHMATEKFVASLHAECDWLLQYHDARKAARTDEIESLKRAKAVLSGADFALLQTRSRGFLERSR